MKDESTPFYNGVASSVDGGLRRYMISVFSNMSWGLALTALIAYLTASSPAFLSVIYSSPMVSILLMLVTLGMVFYLSARIHTMSSQSALLMFLGYALLNGVTLSSVFLVYSLTSIATTFFVASAMFLSMVIYGYSTDKSLIGWGSFLFMGLIGLIVATIVNMFFHNSTFSFVLSILGVLIFTGLTAFDAQLIKSYYFESDTAEVGEKKAILGALRLYLDFINLFLMILKLVGRRD